MARPESAQERAAVAFLERFLADRERDRPQPPEVYLRLFPGAEREIRAQFDETADPAAPAPIVETIGDYRLIRLLGRGGQGEVFEARDERLGRTVALKLLPRRFGRTAGGLPPQIAREWDALQRLEHPGICVAYDAGESDGRAWIAMRLVRGAPLLEHLSRLPEGAVRTRAALALVEKSAHALHAAHRAGVVHRDVKPSNILVNDSGDPVVLDFGLARADDPAQLSFTLTGDLIGTPRYLAPERLRGETGWDPRADVWSLGVTLYEALTGVAPFDGPTLDSVARSVAEDEPPDPRRLRPALPQDVTAVLAMALEKDPARRYADMAAFAEDLRRVQSGEAVAARPLTPLRRTLRWARRNPAPAALLATLAVFLAAALFAVRTIGALAADNAATLREARAHLSRARLEEARLLRGAERHDRVERMLALAAGAADARALAADAQGRIPVEAAALADLRGVAVAALLEPEARLVATHPPAGRTLGAFSPDGAWLAERETASGEDQVATVAIRIRAAASGEIVARSSHPDLLHAEEGIAVAADGRTIAVVGAEERSVVVWDLVADRLLRSLTMPEDVVVPLRGRATRRRWSLSFAPGGAHLVATVAPAETDETEPTPRGFAIWRLADGERLAGGALGTFRYPWACFSRDGAWCAVLHDEKQVRAYQLDEAVAIAKYQWNLPAPVWAGALLDGEVPRMAVVLGETADADHALWIFRFGATETELALPLGASIDAANCVGIACAPDGRRLALADRGHGIRVLDLERGREILRIPAAHPANLDALAWSADGARLHSHGRAGDARVWEPQPDRGLRSDWEIPKGDDPGGLIAIAADGSTLLYAHHRESRNVWTWEPERPRETFRRLTHELPATESPTVYQLLADLSGRRVIRIERQGATVWDLEGDESRRWPAAAGEDFMAAWWSPDGRPHVVVRGAERYALRSLDDGSDRPLGEIRPEQWAELAPDGASLLVESLDTELRLLPLSGAPALSLKAVAGEVVSSFKAMRFSRSGSWIGAFALGDRARFVAWDAHTGDLLLDLDAGVKMGWFSWDASADDRLAAFANDDGRIALADPRRGELLLEWNSDAAPTTVAFLRDGRLVTRAEGAPARVWDLAAMRRELAALDLDWE